MVRMDKLRTCPICIVSPPRKCSWVFPRPFIVVGNDYSIWGVNIVTIRPKTRCPINLFTGKDVWSMAVNWNLQFSVALRKAEARTPKRIG